MNSVRLLAQARAVGTPANYFHGRSYADVCLPNNIIFFRRTTRHELQKATFESRPHHRFVLVFNLGTAGVIHIDGGRAVLEPGQGLMILPFQFHTFPEVARDEILWLILTFEADQPALLEDFRGKVFPLDAETLALIEGLLGLYRAAADETRNQLLGLETARLLARLRPLVRTAVVPRLSADRRALQLLRDIDARLRAAPGEAISVNQLATALHISESRLRARFRAAFSITLGSYLSNYRLHRVIELMRDTRLNLSGIAQELGFADSAAFARFFRTQTGAAPRDFRREMLARTSRLEAGAGSRPMQSLGKARKMPGKRKR